MNADLHALDHLIRRAEAFAAVPIADIERHLATVLEAEHARSAEDLLADVLLLMGQAEGKPSKRALEATVASSTRRRFGSEMGARVTPTILSAVSRMYGAGRLSMDSAVPDWSIYDRRAVDWLANDTLFWVWGAQNNLRVANPWGGAAGSVGEVVAAGARHMIEEGLHSTEIGERLQQLIGGHVPPRAASYWRGLASNAATRSVNMGAAEAFVEGGVTRYEWVSVLDERTSDICEELDGTTFDVEHLTTLRSKMLEADDPETVKEVWRWTSGKEVRGIKDGATGDLGRALAAKGISAPPAHFHCRSQLVVAEFGPLTVPPAPAPRKAKPVPDPKEARRTALAAWNPEDPGNFISGWRSTTPGQVFGTTPVQLTGYADPSTIKHGPLAGMRLSHWPSVAPPGKGQHWWAPIPDDKLGGKWVAARRGVNGPPNAVTRGGFLKWRRDVGLDAAPKARAGRRPAKRTKDKFGLDATIKATADDAEATKYFRDLAATFRTRYLAHLAESPAGTHGATLNKVVFERTVKEFMDDAGGAVGASTVRAQIRVAADAESRRLARETTERFGAIWSRDAWKAYGMGDMDRALLTYSTDRGAYQDNWGGDDPRATAETVNTAMHELGHWIEYRAGRRKRKNPSGFSRYTPGGPKKAIGRFFARRTKGKKARKLSVITGWSGYSDWEKAKDGGFVSIYIGKVYPARVDGKPSTEVLSMGVERMREDRWFDFARQDPEHFGLTLAILTGRIR